MIRLGKREPTKQARQAREDAVSAWDHLRAAAEEGVRRVGDNSRRSKETARERANNAAMALRGQTPRSAIRKWLGTGLAAGAMIGAVAVAMLGRRRHHSPDEDDLGVKDKASAAVDTVRERATTAAHKAATATRDTAAKVSEATKPAQQGNGQSSKEPNRAR